jgi:hypothetical protein
MKIWPRRRPSVPIVAHRERVPTRMPRWYVPFCAVFDWVYAAGLLGIWWKKGVLG